MSDDSDVVKKRVEALIDGPSGPSTAELERRRVLDLEEQVKALSALNEKLKISPNGATTVPQWVIKAGIGAAVISGTILLAPDNGIALPAAVMSAAKLVNLGLLLLGITSQGLRKEVQLNTAKEAGAGIDPMKGLNP